MDKLKQFLNNIYIPIFLLGCSQVFLSSELFSLCAYMVLFWITLRADFKIRIGNSKSVRLLVIILCFGAFVGLKYFGSRNYLRDIYYYLNPLIFVLIGINHAKTLSQFHKMLNTVVGISLFLSIYALLTFVLQIKSGTFSGNMRVVFEYAMWGNVFSIGAIISKNRSNKKGERIIDLSIVIFLVMIAVLGLSRTILLQMLMMIICVLVVGQNKKYAIKKIMIGVMLSAVLVLLLSRIIPTEQLEIFNGKILNSFNEIGSDNKWSAMEIQQNWRGYEMYCVEQQFLHADILTQLIGGGFGTGIKVGSVASMVHQQGDLIYVIHNGYYGMLIKEGVIGLALYTLFFIFSIREVILKLKYTHNRRESFILGLLLCLSLYSYLVKGIFADFVLTNALVMYGAWIGCSNTIRKN